VYECVVVPQPRHEMYHRQQWGHWSHSLTARRKSMKELRKFTKTWRVEEVQLQASELCWPWQD
jgi:hypothetical protein